VALALSTAACGGGATKPLAASVSVTPTPAVDQEAAVKAAFGGYMKAMATAVEQQSADPLRPYATDAWASGVIAQYRANLWNKKKTIIGTNTVASATPTVTGETATLEACVDSSNAFQVPLGTKAIRAGSSVTPLGRWRDRAELRLLDGSWKITKITGGQQKC
jgi:hypothetical protein